MLDPGNTTGLSIKQYFEKWWPYMYNYSYMVLGVINIAEIRPGSRHIFIFLPYTANPFYATGIGFNAGDGIISSTYLNGTVITNKYNYTAVT